MSDVPSNLIPLRLTGLPEYLGTSTLGYLPYVIEGNTYKVQFANIAAVGAVPSTRLINTGTGLGGGGDLSANRTLFILPAGVDDSRLTTTGVTAGTYGSAENVPVFTVNAQGRVTGVTDTPIVLSNYVPTSRTITAGDGLSGGGNLSANRTFAVNFSSTTPEPLGPGSPGVSTVAAREDHVHPAVDLSDTTETQGVLPLSRGGTGNSLSPVVGAIAYSSNDKLYLTPTAGDVGQVLVSAGGLAPPEWQTISGAGTVTSVNASGGTTGLSFTGGPITTSGTLTLGGTLAVANGGTGATDAATALTNLGAYPASNPAGYTTNVGTVTSVDLTAGTGVSVSGGPITSSGSITVTNTAPDQVVSLTAGTNVTITGTYPNFTIAASNGGSGTVTSVAASGGTTGLTFSGSPITTSGTLTLGGTLGIANGGTGATDAATARTNLGAAASGANSDITSLSGITGAISTVDSITFDTTGGVTVGQGQIAWNSNDGTIDIGMGYDAVTQQVGLEQYFRIKASATITDGQCIMFTGAVGASGVLTGAPATGVTNPQYIMGVATMDIANNGFGYVTSFGLVRGIDTTGSSVGETWADGDILYYNPAYTGGLTKVEPIAPLPKAVVASVVNASSGGSGSLFIRVQAEPNLQGLTDVYAPSPISNGQILIGDGPQARWEAATLTAGTNVSITNAAGAITINATDQYSGTVTSVDVSGGTTGLTTSGGPVTSSGTITLAGTLNVANGGTGATTLTANNVLLGNGTSAVQVVAPGTTGNVLTSDGTTWTSAAAPSSAVQYPQNSQSANYTLVLGDAGKQIFHPASDANVRTYTIPANASVAFPIGTVVLFTVENGGTRVNVAITSDTLVNGNGLVGTQSVYPNNTLMCIKVTATKWMANYLFQTNATPFQVAVAHATSPFVTAYPWSSSGFGTKYSNPATLPTGQGNGVAFSPSGDAIAVAHDTTPYITAYPWSGSGFGTKYTNPATLPPSGGNGVAFSGAGNSIAVSSFSSPYVTAYPWDSSTGFGTKYANPATLPAGFGMGVRFSPAGDAIAVVHFTSPYVTAYPWNSSTGFGVKYTDPATTPTGIGGDVAFSPGGDAIAVAHANSPAVSAYPWNSSTGFGVKYSNPATLPTGNGNGVAFSPAGDAIAVANSSSPYITAYPWSISGFGVKYTDPATLPTGIGNKVAFSALGDAIAVAHSNSPYVTAYPWSSSSGFGAKYANPVTLPTGNGYGVAFTVSA